MFKYSSQEKTHANTGKHLINYHTYYLRKKYKKTQKTYYQFEKMSAEICTFF